MKLSTKTDMQQERLVCSQQVNRIKVNPMVTNSTSTKKKLSVPISFEDFV